MDVRKLLRHLLALGFSVSELARVFRVSSQAISQWVSGVNRPSEAHLLDLLDLYALASEHLAQGGALADFTTEGQWRPRTRVSSGGQTSTGEIALSEERSQQSWRIRQGYVNAAGDLMMPLHEQSLLDNNLTLAQVADEMARLAATFPADPLQTVPAHTLHDLLGTVFVLQQTLLEVYWERVWNAPAPSTAPPKGDTHVEQGP